MHRILTPVLRLLPLCLALPTLAVPVSVFEAIRDHLEPSTATFGQTTINLPGSHLSEDSASYSVEASVAPAFTVFHGTLGPLPGAYMFNLVPKFVVRRMDDLPSNPVRTPSYMPSATLFYSPVDTLTQPDYWYLSVGGSHYSNGETGVFLRADSTLNDVNGSFSLWSTNAGVHLYNDWPFLPAYKSLQVEYFHHKEGLLDALYPDYVISLKMQTADHLSKGAWGLSGRSRLLLDLDWRIRKNNDWPDALKPTPFSVSLAGVYRPQWGPFHDGPFGIFCRYYAGYDAYNMSFDKEVHRVDIGIMFMPL